jgi:hypothetical protein
MTLEEHRKIRLDELDAMDEKRLIAQQNLELYQTKMARTYDRMARIRTFRKGELVLVLKDQSSVDMWGLSSPQIGKDHISLRKCMRQEHINSSITKGTDFCRQSVGDTLRSTTLELLKSKNIKKIKALKTHRVHKIRCFKKLRVKIMYIK